MGIMGPEILADIRNSINKIKAKQKSTIDCTGYYRYDVDIPVPALGLGDLFMARVVFRTQADAAMACLAIPDGSTSKSVVGGGREWIVIVQGDQQAYKKKFTVLSTAHGVIRVEESKTYDGWSKYE